MVKKKRAPSAEDRIRLLEDSLEETQKFRDYGSVAQNSAEEKKRLRRKTFGLFSYTNTLDYILIIVGTIASIIHGAGFPLLSIVLGGMTTIFLRAQNSPFVWGPSFNISAAGVPPISREEFDAEVVRYSLYYLLLGVAMLITSYIQIACWESVAERLTHNLRKNYLKAILRQEIAWFDKMQTGNLTARLTDDLERVREGLGDKLSLFIQMLASFVAGFIVGFIYNWQMSLIMLLFTPLLMLASFLMAKTASERTHVEQTKYAVAGGIAEETFSSIRTVLSLNGQHQELRRYEAALEDGRQTGLLKYIYMGLGFAFTALTTYISYAVAFWFGSRLIIWDVDFDRGSIFTVFFAVMSGSTALGGALPNLASISMARGSARMVISVLNSEPKIDPYSDEGIIVSKPKGAISVRNVHFSYPIRKDLQILNGVSFNIEPGQKLALVGSSGCGKSTIISLLLRFYDPDSGSIFLDGQDLKSFNVRSLRDAIGIVSQEPVLFDGTLEENVLLGNEKASRDDVIEVLKQANAYEFIKKLPEGLKTRVGERGVQLSGGQKQRIAIARALIKNPKILLLDEATSALDTESEALVQRALEKAQEGRTTITVAHRLSTIRDVDKILVFRQGEVIESGTHEELMNAHGVFYDMVQQQQIHQLQEGAQLDKIAEENEQNDETSIRVDSTVTGSPRKITSAALSPRRKLTSVSSVRSEGSRMLLEMQQDIEDDYAMLYEKETMYQVCDSRQVQERSKAIERGERVQDSKIKPTPLWKIMKMNRDKWHFFALAIFGCIINGLVVPFFALVYSQIFNVFSEPIEQLNTDALFWSFMFVAIGIANAIGQIISAVCCGQCGEALTKKLRFEAFRNLLRQDIAFYDDQRHNTGKLCTRFATDVPNVRYVFTRLPVVISSVVTLIGAIVIGFAYGWQLALVLLAIIPLIIGSGYFEMKMHFGRAFDATALLEDAGKVATEAVENIRTVAGLNKQLIFHEKYSQHVNDPYKHNLRHAHIYAGVFAFSQSVIFFMYAIAFYLGAIFVDNGSMLPLAVYRVFFAMAFCGQSVGMISSFIPDVVKARLAASLIFHLIEYPTKIDSLSESGVRTDLKGDIKVTNLHFAYPTRPNIRILNGLNLSVKPGKTIALVGHSGCGKSTIVTLLERFYNPLKGQIAIDGINVRDLNIHSLRKQMAIVSQEPTLFDCTIEENISYGMNRPMSHEEVVEAAKMANIHDFILSLPDGYATNVGERGAQLSGGQKQRIAIARALIRRPSILLLDEATSALDSESERIVQDALEKARYGRTCLVIAHRLSTVQNADQICVINEGRIVQLGTHEELIQQEGIYKTLCSSQFLQEDSKED